MQQNLDLIDLLGALNAEGAEYLLVGAYAFAFHGRACATKDVDVFVGSDPQNAQRVWKALLRMAMRPSTAALRASAQDDKGAPPLRMTKVQTAGWG